MTQPNTKSKCSCKKLSWRHTLRLHSDHFTYLLPFHKGNHFFEGNTVLVTSRPSMCTFPLRMMHSYLALRDTNFSLLPELWLMLDGCIPIYSWFVARLHAALAVKGVSDNHIKAAGHWA